ncbi:hypothetical protein HK102_013335 [Quaeritorhiza haematococci]|nr:hypothetical protein HK102_013335 [Quaeritorhiza haematococci]
MDNNRNTRNNFAAGSLKHRSPVQFQQQQPLKRKRTPPSVFDLTEDHSDDSGSGGPNGSLKRNKRNPPPFPPTTLASKLPDRNRARFGEDKIAPEPSKDGEEDFISLALPDVDRLYEVEKPNDARPAAGRGSRRGDEESHQAVDLLIPLPTPPWVPEYRRYSRDPVKMLNEEVSDYVNYMRPTKAEKGMRRIAVDRVRHIIRKIWPTAEVYVFGSFETELFLPSSDIDVVVVELSTSTPKCLYPVADLLRKTHVASKVEVIDKAKVPIVKFTDALTRYQVDISFNVTSGIDSADIVKRFVEQPTCGEALRSMVLILKQFLLQRYLNEVYSGGMGSYALLSIVAAFLKMHPKIQSRQMRPEDNLGILLIEFLEFYGTALNTVDVGVGVNLEKGWLYLKEFARAYNRLTCMIGAFVERELEYEKYVESERRNRGRDDRDDRDRYDRRGRAPDRPPRLKTILGAILNINKAVLQHRDFIEQKWEEVEEEFMKMTGNEENDDDNDDDEGSLGRASWLPDLGDDDGTKKGANANKKKKKKKKKLVGANPENGGGNQGGSSSGAKESARSSTDPGGKGKKAMNDGSLNSDFIFVADSTDDEGNGAASNSKQAQRWYRGDGKGSNTDDEDMDMTRFYDMA